MKKSIESILNKLIAKVELAPLYDPVPLEPGANEVIQKGGGGGRGTEGCGYSVIGMGDPNHMWGGPNSPSTGRYNSTVNHTTRYSDCPLCNGGTPPAFCACIAAYSNPCYNWHWSRGHYPTAAHPDSTWEPPAYSSYPPGCPSREELEGPGYTQEEWVGDPATLSGQRYRWSAWDYLTRIRLPDGNWRPGQEAPGIESIWGYGSENPFDPNVVVFRGPPSVTMGQLWAYWFTIGNHDIIPTLYQRKLLESGCAGVPGQSGSCCTFDDFGGAQCREVSSAGDCDGVFTGGGSCSGDNPCGNLMPNPIQQNDQAKGQKQLMNMVMSSLRRK